MSGLAAIHHDGFIFLKFISSSLVLNVVSDTLLFFCFVYRKVVFCYCGVPERGRDAFVHLHLHFAKGFEMELFGKALYKLIHCG